ncbi:MAG: hypothetical protein RIR80_631, partial [Bacteroidota bacterium]
TFWKQPHNIDIAQNHAQILNDNRFETLTDNDSQFIAFDK